MTPAEIQDAHHELLVSAEGSVRYHRRRATFLKNLATILTFASLLAGASALVTLLGGASTEPAKVGAAMVTVFGIIQAVYRPAEAAAAQAGWMRKWMKLRLDLKLERLPTVEQLKGWEDERAIIESECVGELNALALDCLNEAHDVLQIPGPRYKIRRWQRWSIQLLSWQRNFPELPAPQ